MTIKKLYSFLHLWLGIATGLVFVIACFTGATLAFENEIEELIHQSFYKNTGIAQRGNRYSLDEIFTVADRIAVPYGIKEISINTLDDHHNYIFTTTEVKSKQLLIAINPYTKEIAGVRREDTRFFVIMEDLHRKLLMDKPGKLITGACCLAYLFVLITGLILWWPKNAKILKQRIKVKWDAKFKRLNWDLHSVSGFYAFPFLLIMTFTGLTWSYDWFENGIYIVLDGKLPQETKYNLPKSQNEISIQGALSKINNEADRLLPYQGITELALPGKKPVYSVEKRIPGWVNGKKDKLVFDATTGSVIATFLWKDQSTGTQTRNLMKPIHTGSVFGLTGKTIAFITCVIGFSLPITGIIIWLGRKKKKEPVKKNIVKSSAFA